ncbi:hypothetical protein [Bacillus altitudinis]|uniref:hypothetical protein n=1 Tax=Bacillus altitudinis TaxID=293387 RepID=UPI0018CEE80F|nr:hypothetical protein [Bacillus altitudinis]
MMHVLKDEKLGVDREYVAVDRKAEDGEKIVVTEAEYVDGEFYGIGHYGKVIISDGGGDACVDFKGFNNSFVFRSGTWHVGTNNASAYHVLEPTDIVHIDGERYRLEDRKAEVGELVIDKNVDGNWPGLVSEVLDSLRYAVTISGRIINGKKASVIGHGYYYVLTPVQDAAEAQESDVITVLANLGAEVAELKRKNEQFEQALGWNEMGPGYIPEIRSGLSDLKSVVSNYESEIERMQAEIDALHEDKVRLGEQLANAVADIGGKTELSGRLIADIVAGLKKAGL